MLVENLPSARERSAEENLAEFIRYAREDIAAFGRELDFGADVWDVSSTSNHRPSAGHQASNIAYLTHQTGRKSDVRTPLAEPFASFIKSVIRRRQEAKASHMYFTW